ncbi:MAG: aspartate kinase [archaeon]
MLVMKFGGSSVATSERIINACKIIKSSIGKNPVVVFSALGTSTDNLLEAGNKALKGEIHVEEIRNFHLKVCQELGVDKTKIEGLLGELDDLITGLSLIRDLAPKTKDLLVSFGERLSVRIISEYLNAIGIRAKFFDAWDIGFVSDSNFVNARLLPETYERVAKALAPLKRNYSYTPVITGFLAKDEDGNITTTGRGGSDLTASVIGAAIKADKIEIWKDVDGLFTTDPGIVPNALHVPKVSFEEASELAYFGAKVFHPRSILPAMSANIPVVVRNSFKPSGEGTIVLKEFKKKNSGLTGISFKKNIIVIDIISTRMVGQSGFLARVFNEFRELGISVDLIATSEVSISLTIDDDRNLRELHRRLEEIANVNIRSEKASISLVGDVNNGGNVMGRLLVALARNGIAPELVSYGASKVSASIVVDNSKAEECVKILHKEFFSEAGK